MKTIEQAQSVIKSNVSVSEFRNATDGVNLLMVAIGADGLSVASIYKSFDHNFNQILIVRYVNSEY